MRALDLFCGAGGVSYGLNFAGFEVTGVDIASQPNYPYSFIQADALTVPLDGYDFIWASPPCQAYSPLNAYNKKSYPDLVAPIRERLKANGKPYCIENVMQAPLINPTMLCGTMFGLKVYRHRGFETSFEIIPVPHLRHKKKCARNGYLPTRERPFMTITGGKHSAEWRKAAAKALGIHWTTDIREICEAIPPAYSTHIAKQFLHSKGESK